MKIVYFLKLFFLILIFTMVIFLNPQNPFISIASANTTYWFNDTFTDETKIESKTNITISSGDTYLSGYQWQSDSAIKSGFTNVGEGHSSVNTFQMDNIWYSIIGTGFGDFDGYNWTGSTWQSDSAIVSGLGDIGEQSKPTVFNMSGTWYLISGERYGGFYGFNWTGSTWQEDDTINSSLIDIADWSSPTVFQKGSIWYLISGSDNGYQDPLTTFTGYNWSGTQWQSDSSIVTGLIDLDRFPTPTVFNMSGTWYLISGEGVGGFFGFNWTGSTWQSDSAIVSGLGDIGEQSTPTVFNMSATWYLISGEGVGGFFGFNWTLHTSGVLTSITNTTPTSGNISSVTPTINDNEPTSTNISYNCSNDNGTTWESVTSGTQHNFTSAGNQFKWRTNLTTTNTSVTPTIYDVAFYIDSNAIPTKPSLLELSNGSYTNDNTPLFNWSDSDADGDSLTRYIEIDNETGFNNPLVYSNYSISQSNFTLPAGDALSEGLYYWRIRANDGYENSSWADYYNFTVDTILPVIELDSTTLNTTSYFKNSIKVNFARTEINHNRTWYNVTNATAVVVSNTTITANTTFNVETDGEYTLVVYSDDKAGNENSTNVTFKADVGAPSITNMAVSDTTVLVGETVTITCDVNDTYAGVESVTIQVNNPKAVKANHTLSHVSGDSYSFEYSYTGAAGTYEILYFYAYDNATGSDGNLKTESSSLYFNAISYTEGGPGGGGTAPVVEQNETIVEVFLKPIGILENYIQRFFIYKPFYDLKQERMFEFKTDKPIRECISSEGICTVDPDNNCSFYVLYSPSDDEFFVMDKLINITVYDKDDYTNYAQLDLTVINLGAWIPIKPIKVGTPEIVNLFFKMEKDVEDVGWITGIRVWFLVLLFAALVCIVGGYKKKEVKKYWSKWR